MIQAITTKDEWGDILKQSDIKTVIVYKHSSTCSISREVLGRLEKGIADGRITDPIYMLIVQDSRELSEAIAEDIGLQHESPQMILIKEGQVLYSASHYDITVDDMIEYIHQ